MKPLRTCVAAVALTIVFAAALDTGPARAGDTTPPQSGTIIRDAWARTTPAGASMGALYLTIQSAVADRLVGAEVPQSVAAATQIHETVVVADSSGSGNSGSMTMRPVAFIELPPGEAVQLKPGGYHIMLIDLKKPLKAGDHVKLTLVFERAGKRKATATVRDE